MAANGGRSLDPACDGRNLCDGVVEDLDIYSAIFQAFLLQQWRWRRAGQSEKKTTITTEDGKTVTISANGNDAENGTATITTDDGDKVTFGSGPASGKNLPLGIP